MKRATTYGLAAGVMIAGAIALTAPIARGGISGTPHDLSGKGWGTDQICIFCHTPHNANTTVSGSPLWNHAVTTQTFQLYTSPSLDATLGQPGGVSKLCLSCHDGTVAMDSYGTRAGTHTMTGTANLGTDLRDDHPVSFTYDATLVTTDTASRGGIVGLQTPSSAAFVDAGHTVPLFASKLECGSCHNVHDNANTKFLRVNNAGSALCLKCHIK